MWTTAYVEISVKIKAFWALHFDETKARTLEILVAVGVVRVIIAIDFQWIFISESNAIRFTRCERIID